jgi:hypothetical protein
VLQHHTPQGIVVMLSTGGGVMSEKPLAHTSPVSVISDQ